MPSRRRIRDIAYIAPSALEFAGYEPEQFPSDDVEEILDRLEETWSAELGGTVDRIFARWDEIARAKGVRDILDAAARSAIEFDDVQGVTNEEWDATLAAMEESGALLAWTVLKDDGSERDIPMEERREFAGRVLSRYLERRFAERRAEGVIALQLGDAPAGVEFLHRELVLAHPRAA
jgi:hypothetical protein